MVGWEDVIVHLDVCVCGSVFVCAWVGKCVCVCVCLASMCSCAHVLGRE